MPVPWTSLPLCSPGCPFPATVHETRESALCGSFCGENGGRPETVSISVRVSTTVDSVRATVEHWQLCFGKLHKVPGGVSSAWSE